MRDLSGGWIRFDRVAMTDTPKVYRTDWVTSGDPYGVHPPYPWDMWDSTPNGSLLSNL